MALYFPLEIRGKGSVDIESLGSYIHRLAIAHCVSVYQLLNHSHCIHVLSNTKSRYTASSSFSMRGLSLYVRPDLATKRIVDILEHVTGRNDLRSTTLLALRKILNDSSDIYKGGLYWCPECMSEFKNRGDQGYYKLIWNLKEIDHCLIHQVRLMNHCPHCGSHQSSYSMRNKAIECQKCGEDLSSQATPIKVCGSHKSNSHDIISLIEYIARNPRLEFPQNGVIKTYKYIIKNERVISNDTRLWPVASTLEMIKNEYEINFHTKNYCQQNKLSLFQQARRLAFRAGMKLTDVLSGNISGYIGLFDSRRVEHYPQILRPVKKSTKSNKVELRNTLISVLNNYEGYYNPPLRVVAKDVGVPAEYLISSFPHLAKEIAESHKIWLESEKEKKHLIALAAAVEYFSSYAVGSVFGTKISAYQKISGEKLLPEPILKDAINRAYNILSKNSINGMEIVD